MLKFPFGFWNYTPLPEQGLEQVKLWADCGITLTMNPNYQEDRDDKRDMLRLLDECEKYDIRPILRDRRTNMDGEGAPLATYRENFIQAYDDFGHHPASFGFYVGDEPSETRQSAYIQAAGSRGTLLPN